MLIKYALIFIIFGAPDILYDTYDTIPECVQASMENTKTIKALSEGRIVQAVCAPVKGIEK
jgi:hypothetical protein